MVISDAPCPPTYCKAPTYCKDCIHSEFIDVPDSMKKWKQGYCWFPIPLGIAVENNVISRISCWNSTCPQYTEKK